MFYIEWKEDAIRNLHKFPSITAKRIFSKVDDLKKDPFLKDIKRLKGSNTYRLRVGDYRVLFEIFKDKIIILKVGHRKNIYKR